MAPFCGVQLDDVGCILALSVVDVIQHVKCHDCQEMDAVIIEGHE